MPKGIRYGGRAKGTPNKKTIWLMESLAEHGYDYEAMLTKFLEKAAKGDQVAYGMAQLLVKMVPYLANMPKADAGIAQIETLVINRYELASEPATPEHSSVVKQDIVDTTAEGIPPSDLTLP